MSAVAPRRVTLLGDPAWAGPPRVRLFCFPYAGAGVAGHHAWRKRLAPDIELALVHLPGREARLGEAPLGSMSAIIEDLHAGTGPLLDEVPFAFFGHSLGARIAFDYARWLDANGRAIPLRLFLSGSPAPHLPDPLLGAESLPDEGLVTALLRLGGTPSEVLRHPELMALVLPVLRADLTALRSASPPPDRPVPVAITAFAGEDDPIAPPDHVGEWARYGSAFTLHVLSGDHFFVAGAKEEIIGVVEAMLLDRNGPRGDASRGAAAKDGPPSGSR